MVSAVVAYEIAVGGITTDERSLSLILVRADDEGPLTTKRVGSEASRTSRTQTATAMK